METNCQLVDLGILLIANLFNVGITAIMLSRPLGLKGLERALGLALIGAALPAGIALVLNATGGRQWWTVVLPLPYVLHSVVELLVDHVLHLDFRRTRWLWPYLVIFYAGQWGLMGYSFLACDRWGFLTLGTYLFSLAATAFSYAKVRHG